MMDLNDHFPSVRGHLEIWVREGGYWAEREILGPNGKAIGAVLLPVGKVLQRVDGPNLCLDRMRVQMNHLIVGHETNQRFANRMVFGTGGHAVGDTSTPISPETSDSGLESQVLQKPLATFEFPTATSVRCIAVIVESEANGFTISESGIMSADNTLIARRTFPGLPKTSDFVFEFRHVLIF